MSRPNAVAMGKEQVASRSKIMIWLWYGMDSMGYGGSK